MGDIATPPFAATDPVIPARRGLFVATIFAGSFLLFLVQPLVARLALPRLGGAPNVWNSAMLVYQALLLGGYLYAHLLGALPLRRQAQIHLALLALAVLTLPIALYPLAPAVPGTEALWVPALLALSVGPVFLLVSAQAPLIQRWFAASPAAGDPYPLYAASNLGSFAGLLAYPLVAEPLLSLRAQSIGWTAGYLALLVLVGLAAWTRRAAALAARFQPAPSPAPAARPEPVPARRIVLWLLLSAVPSGLMLSTTTHLTTDVFAMPLLWVIPLGLYLLSFVIAFSANRALADVFALFTPAVLLAAGGFAMVSTSAGTMVAALVGLALLFDVSVTLHSRLYAVRPEPERLTLFYFFMSVGGVLGGVLCALLAPVVFDWTWEHPLLVLAAAALVPLPRLLDWRRLPGLTAGMTGLAVVVLFCFALFLAWLAFAELATQGESAVFWPYALGLALVGTALLAWRRLFVAVLAVAMVALGGYSTISDSLAGIRTRSYFGIYTVRDYADRNLRTLAHGTTLHGEQRTDPAHRSEPVTYYGLMSGAGLVFSQVPRLAGPDARVGVVGLGAGTLACYHQPGQRWRFFEIDPTVLAYSRAGTFTFLRDCAPDAQVVLGDARLKLAQLPPASLDLLAVDAFSSDAIPLHLLTTEALGVYFRALSPRGLLLIHISNRHIELEPVLAANARAQGLAAMVRDDNPPARTYATHSVWVLFARDPARLAEVRALGTRYAGDPALWEPLAATTARPWTDDHASVLPYVRWSSLLR